VLFDPPFKGSTYVLWLGPFAILMLAAIGVAIFFRRRAQEPARTRELSADEPAGSSGCSTTKRAGHDPVLDHRGAC
jgi:cytochrome c-type biogenesis protein CcmH/NrfF